MSQRSWTDLYADATEASIRAAAVKANALGGGIVHIPQGDITLTSPLTVYSGVRYKGVDPVLSFSLDSPDSAWAWVSGTQLHGDGTFACFEANNTDQGSPASPFGSNAISNFGVKNLAINNFTYGVHVGAVNNFGFMGSLIKNIWFTSCSQWAISLSNFMHSPVERVWARNCQNGYYFAASGASSVVMPGNTRMHSLFNIIPNDGRDNRLCRGIVFDANVANAILNEIYVDRIQNNSFNRTKLSVSATFNGTANIGVPDSTKFMVGMPVTFTASANGFTANQTYIVLSAAANVITLGNSRTSAAIVASGSTGLTLESWGMPCMEVISAAASAKVQNSKFFGVDIEGASSAGLYVENGASNEFNISEIPGSAHNHIVGRSASFSTFRSNNGVNHDFDGSSTTSEFYGTLAANRQRVLRGNYRDSTLGVEVLSVRGNGTTAGGDFHQRGGSSFLYPNFALGFRISQRDTSVTLGAAQAGFVVFNGASGQTFTLPTLLTDATVSTTQVGMWFWIHNVSANSLALATDGSQLLNNTAAKTSITIASHSSVLVIGTKTAGGTLYWGAFSFPEVA
jgi:hypothetical protein